MTFNQTADANLTMSSTISTVKVLGQPIKLPMGQHITLSGQALDRDGYVLVLVGGALQWTLVSGNAFADLTPDGVLTGKTPGTARVRLSEPGAGISDEADVQIIATTLSLANSGWAKYRGGIGNGAVGAGSGATNNIKWNTTLTASSADAIHMVIGADGTLYVPDNTTGALTAYDSAGAQKWTAAGVSANGGVVIASDGTAIVTSPNRKLQTLDSATQAVKWTFNDTGSSNYSGPTLAPNGLIYMVADNTLYAISSDSGALAWKYVADAPLIPSTPCIGPDGTVFISTNASVQAISAGQMVWRAALESGAAAPIAMPVLSSDGSTLFISGLFYGSYSLYALSSSSGAFLWKYAGANWFGSLPAVSPTENVVYYINGHFSSGIVGFNGGYNLFAFDGATGNQKWSYSSGGFVGTSNPIVAADGIVYYGYDYNPGGTFNYPSPAALLALKPTDGSAQWAYISPNGGTASVYPAAVGSDGTLYAVSSGSLIAFK